VYNGQDLFFLFF